MMTFTLAVIGICISASLGLAAGTYATDRLMRHPLAITLLVAGTTSTVWTFTVAALT